VALDEPHDELPLALSLEGRYPEVGRAGLAFARRLPHAVCQHFLPALLHPTEWKHGRVKVDAAAALGMVLHELVRPVNREADAVVLALPLYMTPGQVTAVVRIAQQVKLPLHGTVAAPLAVAADLADSLSAGLNPAARLEASDEPVVLDGPGRDWIVPLHPKAAKPAGEVNVTIPVPPRPAALPDAPPAAVVIDADDHALSAAVVGYHAGQARLLTSAVLPRLGARFWKERLLDSVADRCIRLCRRDPRDSAAAEQGCSTNSMTPWSAPATASGSTSRSARSTGIRT
jgi:hypothetical protein